MGLFIMEKKGDCFMKNYNDTTIDSLKSKYFNTDCIMEKAKVINQLRSVHHIQFVELSEMLFEVERVLYRFNRLNNLIPELQALVEKGQIRRLKAYHLAGLEPYHQRMMYHEFKEQMIKNKQEEFMRIVKTVADLQKLEG